MNDLVIGDLVACLNHDGSIDLGTIQKIVGVESPTYYVEVDGYIDTYLFHRNEVIKTYTNTDMDIQIKTLIAL